MHRLRLILFTVLMSCCSLCLLFAQTPNATIDGRVMDPSKAVLDGVRIEATQIDTGLKYATQTNPAGLFTLGDLPPGTYRLELSKPGFRTIIKPGVELHVQDVIALNFDMVVGSVTESITVQGGAPLVDTESSTVKTSIDRQFVKETPLNGRSFQTLFQLTPGAVITTTGPAEQGQFSINGQRADANYFTVDGVSANVGIGSGGFAGQLPSGALPALTAGGGTNNLVSVDALQEFTIQTSGYAPEFGRTPGGQISMVTRSGTNQFHGTAYDYFRNDVLDANDWFADNLGLPKAALRQNFFGGVLGGPIIQNKTFFFFSYEGLRLRQPTTAISDVPDLASRQSALPSTQPFLNAFPLPTGPDEGGGLAPADYSYSNPSTNDSASLRIDHRIRQNLTGLARYNRSTSSTQTRGFNAALNEITHLNTELQTATAGLIWAARPTIGNDFRFNWSWTKGSTFYTMDSFGGAVPISLQSVLPPGVNPAAAQFNLAASGTSESAQYFLGGSAANFQRQLNMVDTVSWQAQAHQLKFGVDYRRLTPQLGGVPYRQLVGFNTPSDLAAGNPTQGLELGAFFGPVNLEYANYSLFAQDTWRARNRLTVTYGLRWEYNPAPSGHGAGGLPALVVRGISDLPNATPAPPGTPIYHATVDNFAPRLGVAYDISGAGHTGVVRAGFGVFYDLGTSATGSVFSQFPFTTVAFSAPSEFPLTAADAAPIPASVGPPYAEMDAFPATLRQPYTYHWNLSVEESLARNQSLTLGYLGAAGHSLLRQDLFGGAAVAPNFLTLQYVNNSGYSNYNALQLQLKQRSTHGLEILGQYTYAHSLDNVSEDSSNKLPTDLASARGDYGSSDFDIRHTGTVAVDYQIPTLSTSKLGKALLGGWGLNTFIIARSAPPVDVTLEQFLGFGFQSYRPDVVPGVPFYLSDSQAPGGKAINPAAFAFVPGGQQGDLGRNALRGFPLFQQDFSVRRTFRLREKLQLQARLEAFNVLNHPNFAPPLSSFGFVFSPNLPTPPNFGVSRSTFANGVSSDSAFGVGFNPIYQVGGPRSLQMALKLEF
jgi:Carboxypeptidase regulatory-like domain/TonB dependent receptor-like, beta-barrel/TonB-dependent Receptor Plug Domain